MNSSFRHKQKTLAAFLLLLLAWPTLGAALLSQRPPPPPPPPSPPHRAERPLSPPPPVHYKRIVRDRQVVISRQPRVRDITRHRRHLQSMSRIAGRPE
ncbi:MAG: hypothetical protein AAGJ37_15985 [Pseudomonadota bacterium]